MDVTNGVCIKCQRAIDTTARLCPYCGADQTTGERVDTQAILDEVFRPKETTTSETVMKYARHRQGVVMTVGIIVAFLVLVGLHQFASMRNNTSVTTTPPVPLTEITDLSNQTHDAPAPVPQLDFMYDGNALAMRKWIYEPGATTPPEIVAQQQAAAQAAAAAAAAKNPAVAGRPNGVPATPNGAAAAPRPQLPAAPATR